MARIMIPIKEHELTETIRTAQAEKRDVPMDPWQLSRLAYGYVEFEKIEEHLRKLEGFPRAQVSMMVGRLVGVAHALSRITNAGLVPSALYEHVKEQLDTWQYWAQTYATHCESDEDRRRRFANELDEVDVWRLWARQALDGDQHGFAGTSGDLMRDILARLDERTALLTAGTQDRLEGALGKEDGWFRWAQQALGLSDAYVEEQKLGVDDLRRMIRERL